MTAFHELTREMAPELAAFWREAHPDLPLTEALLAERIFGPEDARPDCLFFFGRDGGEEGGGDGGKIEGFAAVVPPQPYGPKSEMLGGIRWLGARATDAKEKGNLENLLLDESCKRLQGMGAEAVVFLSTPPFYLRPGVDIAQTDRIAWLLGHGFEHERTISNMTARLDHPAIPPLAEILAFDQGGYGIRRATENDRAAFVELCSREWTDNWVKEASQGLGHDPISLFLATHRGEPDEQEQLVGFASYETSLCLGSFGPTGVQPTHRGHGLGRQLLFATLADMKALGRETAEIGWVGPVEFYQKAVAAQLGPEFSRMIKRFEETAESR